MSSKAASIIEKMLVNLERKMPAEQWKIASALFEAAFAVSVHGIDVVPDNFAKTAVAWKARRAKLAAPKPAPVKRKGLAAKAKGATSKGGARSSRAKA